jgi:regulatory protein
MDVPDTPAELKARALRHLARREHSRAELSRRLAPHAESAEALLFLLDELEKRKQLCDERYAEVRSNWMARKYGAAKIRQDLKGKGIADAVAARVTAEGELERAKAILARKYRDTASTREEKARRVRFLQGRGFSFDTIRGALAVDEEDVRS